MTIRNNLFIGVRSLQVPKSDRQRLDEKYLFLRDCFHRVLITNHKSENHKSLFYPSTTSIVWVLPSETRGIAATEQASPSTVTREMPRVTP